MTIPEKPKPPQIEFRKEGCELIQITLYVIIGIIFLWWTLFK